MEWSRCLRQKKNVQQQKQSLQKGECITVEWTTRKAVKEDESRIKNLFVEMLQAIHSTQNVHGYEDGYLDKFFGDRDDWICVAEVNGCVIAYLSIEVHREQEEFIYLDDLSVSEHYRSNGIGTDLIKIAEKFAQDIGIPTVILHVEKSNRSAFKLYRRLGYSIMGEEGTRFKMVKRSF